MKILLSFRALVTGDVAARNMGGILTISVATYTFDGDQVSPGLYRVGVTWHPFTYDGSENRTPAPGSATATYHVLVNGALVRTVVHDQTAAPSDFEHHGHKWADLGFVNIPAGRDVTIEVDYSENVLVDGALLLEHEAPTVPALSWTALSVVGAALAGLGLASLRRRHDQARLQGSHRRARLTAN